MKPSTSPNRYSARPSAAVPPRRMLLLGVTSKAPRPSARRGGSPGEPIVICAAAGRARSARAARTIAAAAAYRPELERPTVHPRRLSRVAAPPIAPVELDGGILKAMRSQKRDPRGTRTAAPRIRAACRAGGVERSEVPKHRRAMAALTACAGIHPPYDSAV